MADEMDQMVDVGGQTASLADLAGIDTDQIPETRGSSFPAGAVQFKCEKAELGIFGSDDTKKAGIKFELKCTNVMALLDSEIDMESVVGRTHNEVVFIAGKDSNGNVIDPMQKIGYTKTFMGDAGFKGSGKLQDLLAQFTGHEFLARIKHRKNPNDPDQPFAGLGIFVGFWKVAPVGETLPT